MPQFIETESKIVGPLTLKQFLYIAAAGLISFGLFFILKLFIWILFTIVIALIAASFAFLKFNGRPLTGIIKSAFLYYWNPRLYLWQREEAKAQLPTFTMPKLGNPPTGPTSKMKAAWLSLITKKNPPAGGSGV